MRGDQEWQDLCALYDTMRQLVYALDQPGANTWENAELVFSLIWPEPANKALFNAAQNKYAEYMAKWLKTNGIPIPRNPKRPLGYHKTVLRFLKDAIALNELEPNWESDDDRDTS